MDLIGIMQFMNSRTIPALFHLGNEPLGVEAPETTSLPYMAVLGGGRRVEEDGWEIDNNHLLAVMCAERRLEPSNILARHAISLSEYLCRPCVEIRGSLGAKDRRTCISAAES